MCSFLKENKRKVKRVRINSIEDRNFHWLSGAEMGRVRKEEIKYQTLRSKINGAVARIYHNFLYIRDPKRKVKGMYARYYSCAEEECHPCKSGDWAMTDEETGYLIPACQN